MRFRPCIDVHNGKVKQIVGSSLKDEGNLASENFVSQKESGYFAELYKKDGLLGGHVILLNSRDSEFYEASKHQVFQALEAYPQGLQAGGGICPSNAEEFLKHGASHVIVTSYVFCDGKIHRERLKELLGVVGKEHLVLDLSCRRKGDDYYIVTDRWQKFSETILNEELLEELSECCDEYLIHAVDVEGKAHGIEKNVASLLGGWAKIPMTYAGGVSSFEDLEELYEAGKGKVDVTIGSALDLFGGALSYRQVLERCGC